MLVGLLLMVSGAGHVIVFLLRGGPWEGPVSFRKAVTFGLAFGLTVITVAWVQRMVTMPARLRRIVLFGFVVACVVEVALVTVQAWRGVPSHFNRDSGVDSAVSSVLAAGGFVIVAASAVMAVAAFRRPVTASPVMALGVRAGYAGFLLALAVGAAMIARGVSIENTGSAAEAYHHAGSLKPAHADTMHAILILPLIAWLLERGRWVTADRLRLLLARGGRVRPRRRPGAVRVDPLGRPARPGRGVGRVRARRRRAARRRRGGPGAGVARAGR